MEQMPTEWEQDVAEIYVNYRKLDRPKTSIKTAIIYGSIFVLVTAISVALVHIVLINVGIIISLPLSVQEFYRNNPLGAIVVLSLIIMAVELFFLLKYAVIGIIKIYQHYAPEEIRRRCLFMPTCSEYTIMAVRRYGCIVGLCKSWYRLVYLCRGNIYRIHYPWDK